ncbi:hypothetical protein DdX_01311 [Ditylenchus destructor]|uniref:Saposin B-type domain-containing protein n=1 Tax=Ditylenchus destructor TaxID=166010 RepID=A0AAD4NIK5_9BILA|nr:hypothetical protein DdX_01311 [Ditylenchus destructor]
MSLLSLISIVIMFFSLEDQVPTANANNNVFECVLCEIVVETISSDKNLNTALSSMYRRCSRMGLLSPICVQLVDKNAKILLSQIGTSNVGSSKNMCIQQLKLCDRE